MANADSATLRGIVLAKLPANVAELLKSIEHHSGLPVQFAKDESPVKDNSPPNAGGVVVAPTDATVYLRDTDNIGLRTVTHELQHIHRYWVEGVPQLQPQGPAIAGNRGFCQAIENEIEHLVIVPRERELGFAGDSKGHWNAVSRHRWESYPWPNLSDADKRCFALMGRLDLELAPDPKVHDLARAKLKEMGLTDEAEKFAEKILKTVSHPPSARSCLVRFFQLPRQHMKLVFIDIKKREARFEDVPAH